MKVSSHPMGLRGPVGVGQHRAGRDSMRFGSRLTTTCFSLAGLLFCVGLVLSTEIPQALLDVPRIPVCDSDKRVSCVVDGDTVWIAGTKYRLEDIDAGTRRQRRMPAGE